jgi:2-oxo-4-hydroxy-4-carboxy-5-ureidoimidazoline decarboxylase
MTLEDLNNLESGEATAFFTGCCHCERWAREMDETRPFNTEANLLKTAELLWAKSSENEKLEAFAGHPRIGDLDALRNRYAVSANREQGQIVEADDKVLKLLRDQNQRYLEMYGFIFIVCATGKSAAEMLGLLEGRLGNDREAELKNAAREQAAITSLRLLKLIED